MRILFFFIIVFLSTSISASENIFRIAVAANFKKPLEHLIENYKNQHANIQISVSSGASGSLYHQIIHGAPYNLFVSADERYPSQLELHDVIARDNQAKSLKATYAFGRIALWHPNINIDTLKALSNKKITLAIANPKIAPYGKAALNALSASKINTDSLKLVQGHSISQAHQLVQSGNAQAGILAYSQLQNEKSVSLIDESLYQPIRQQMALLKPLNPSAYSFYRYILSDEAQIIIRDFGYHPAKSLIENGFEN